MCYDLNMTGKKITQLDTINFAVDTFGLYAILIKARCRSGKLLGLWGGENLRVEIDNIKPRETPSVDKPQYVDIPPAWNGTALKGLAKTVIFLLPLNKGSHTLKLIPTRGAIIETYSITPIQNPPEISFSLDDQAEDGDRRPWYAFALIDLPLESLTADVTVDWHLFDGDDVKLIVDGHIEQNRKSIFWGNWAWHAKPEQIFSGVRREEKTFVRQLTKDVHYIEFWVDKTPTLHTVTLDLGDYTPKRIPTVEDPEWTGGFADDPDQIILARALFGEARKTLVPDKARVAIGWVIKNRVKSNRWPNTYWGVITEPEQFSSFNKDDPNREYVEDPLYKGLEIDKTAWEHSYKIAGKIINSEVSDLTKRANHYYDDSINTPGWAEKQKPTLTISYVNEYEERANIFFFKL
ncbi:MAG: hypothetical protein US54_C0001G0062 [Candidatus Roizmanbacteria bacterium GW2011_GWA2_37_7]|uniref:Cell wall hydrolase SleB domain-containing protein n=1 Tax=Candidatus Roizmanbacteria bacterium GW2011_GWA2_37_7 TaxID=1618481 RepID=A0A0G0H9X2_9BACT|nr:MAG: hypothetical protein US54_C0001G0062 [Candidatus Roizmanbacteria bacterium GW2011_GWA2_37_7]